MATAIAERPTADELNAHLAAGGVVQVTTYARSVLYQERNAGQFVELADGALAVRRGRSVDRLSMGGRLLVDVRMGRYE